MPSKKNSSVPAKDKATASNRGRPISGKLTPEVLAGILDAYSAGTCLMDACHKFHVSLQAFNQYKARNPDFANGPYAEAHARSTEAMEALAHKLAMAADSKSCTMLIFMLKARKPEVYRENINLTGRVESGFADAFAAAMVKEVHGSVSQAH